VLPGRKEKAVTSLDKVFKCTIANDEGYLVYIDFASICDGARQVREADFNELQSLSKLEGVRVAGDQVTHRALLALARCRSLIELELINTPLKDDALPALLEIPNLQRLTIQSQGITDKGAEHLGKLRRLTLLEVHNSQLTDEGIAHLSRLRELKSLVVGGHRTRITGKSLEHFKKMTSLEVLDVSSTRLQHFEVDKLQEMLPECKIIH
jgi:Leucine-rich repeat (LRR) protein